MAALEGADRSLAFTSGMAALAAVTKLVKGGEHIVAGDDLYGGTSRLLSQVGKKGRDGSWEVQVRKKGDGKGQGTGSEWAGWHSWKNRCARGGKGKIGKLHGSGAVYARSGSTLCGGAASMATL